MTDSGTELEEQVCAVAGYQFRLRVPRQPEQVLAAVAVQGTTDRDPYWGYLWPAAKSLAALILAADWDGRSTALELGCGSGLAGIAALRAGLDVTFTDLVPEAVQLAVDNAALNGFPNVEYQVLDWRQSGGGKFEVILASDVLYQPELHAALIDVIRKRLAPGGVCWIGDPGRESLRAFLSAVSDTEFSINLQDETGREILLPGRGSFSLLTLRRRSLNASEFDAKLF